jgi:hypothetical protein
MSELEYLDVVFFLLGIEEFRINSGFFSLCARGIIRIGIAGRKDF